jgi:hypothetical protein
MRVFLDASRIVVRKQLRPAGIESASRAHNKMLYPRIFNTQHMAAGDINEP